MKLIEKLSREYKHSRIENFVSTTSNEEAFEAGFRKARELALEVWESRDPHAQWGHTHVGCGYFFEGRDRLESLGEENVK